MEKKLDFKWDKKEQEYSRRTRRKEAPREGKKNVEEYLDFLTEIEPQHPGSVREDLPDCYFSL